MQRSYTAITNPAKNPRSSAKSAQSAFHPLVTKRMKYLRSVVRIVWIGAGLLFLAWQFNSFRAQGFDFAALTKDGAIQISEEGPALEVMPISASQPVGLIFYPGGMVEPRAYLPLAYALAERGYPVRIVKLPWRSAPLASQEEALHAYVRSTIAESIIPHWVMAGHSRGGALAARFVHADPAQIDALILIGTTHPKMAEFSLAASPVPVTKIYATRDGIADPASILANRQLLPPTTTFLPIDGGNHSQFGYYGFQLLDQRATISRAEQQRQVVAAISKVMAAVAAK